MDQITVYCEDQRQINFSKSVLCEHNERIRILLRPYSNKTSVFLYLPYSLDILQQIKEYLEEKRENIKSIKNAMDIFRVGKRLNIRDLNRVCREFMTNLSRVKDVCYVYEFACQLDDWRLEYLCWNILCSKWQEIFSSDEWLNCKATTIDRLVRRPINRFIEEADVFSIVLKWAKKSVNNEKSLRKVMEPFLPYIRFLTMPEWFLESQVFVEPILTDVERDAIRCYLQNKDFDDTWFIPDSICAIKCPRKNELLSSWLSYVNRSAYFINAVKRMNRNIRFICEIVVKEDCFINELHLPITHCRKEGITVILNISPNLKLPTEYRFRKACNTNGYILSSCPLRILKFTFYRLIVRIVETYITAENDIRISLSENYYNPFEGIQSFKYLQSGLKLQDEFEYICFDVVPEF
ncbi:uncharacterized protein LOC111630778 [Centruroides sculpturatus]|uniref:uncharacterized protein LOC111630778 n=1 Tax=Centruroides sculpturatus TaxID=218467 RepID=UPI000C6C96CC|nr:uncharacterized protein LOC111630778 [Centruroides sculpturatus]